MEAILHVIDIFLHLDKYLQLVIEIFGAWTYVILFLIIFCETGLVVTPFLPGDSLLFAAGAFSATGSLHVGTLYILLGAAAILGNMTNYQVGYFLGPKVFQKENSRIFRKEYLDRTHQFYEKYGGLTIIVARFVPIVRTFAPFLAGVGRMNYWRYTLYNVTGCLAWITAFIIGGYYFGNIPVVKRNFMVVILTIIVLSIMPTAIEVLRRRKSS